MNYSEELAFFQEWKKELYDSKTIAMGLALSKFLHSKFPFGIEYKDRQDKAVAHLDQLDSIKKSLEKLYSENTKALKEIDDGFISLFSSLKRMDSFLFNEPDEVETVKKRGRKHYPLSLCRHINKLAIKRLSKQIKYDFIEYFKEGNEFDVWIQKKSYGSHKGPRARPKAGEDPYNIKWIEGFLKAQKTLAEA